MGLLLVEGIARLVGCPARLEAMRAALFIEPGRVEAGDRRDPGIVEPTDARTAGTAARRHGRGRR